VSFRKLTLVSIRQSKKSNQTNWTIASSLASFSKNILSAA
jgi:hypothetical protein